MDQCQFDLLGRIVVASLREFTVECFAEASPPPFGALVAVAESEPAVYGVVTDIITEGVDPSRPIAPHGTAEEDLETVLSRNPHLPVLLRTSFRALINAHVRHGAVCHYLPAAPPRLVSRVRLCDPTEQRRVVDGLSCLQPLVQGGAGDEVLTAFIRNASLVQPDRRAFLVGAGRALVPLLAAEPDRLATVIRGIRPS
jgi:hypothetical protein